MDPVQIHLLRKSFATIEGQADVAALIFYQRLFELEPSLRQLFCTPIHVQGGRLMESLGLFLSLLERPNDLRRELEALGARHIQYGTQARHYTILHDALFDMIGRIQGLQFTPELRAAWEDLYSIIASTMQEGAAKVSAKPSANPSPPPLRPTPVA